ncbi:MAG TPA: DUF2231 domain-containing protein [Actinomycetota bacterium]
MPRRFSFRPALTIKGRRFQGLRGFSGKPFHPPLTDVPIGAYMIAAAFDAVSWLWSDASWAHELYHAAGWVMLAGAVVSLGAALTGFMDWLKSTPKGTQARRTANAHAVTMLTVTGLVVVNLVVRFTSWDEPATTSVILALSLLAAALTFLGAAIGGSLVFDYGFNVRTAGDSPAWHESETDLMPGQKPPAAE